MEYASVIVRYKFLGENIDDEYHEDDWNCFHFVTLKEAIGKFWLSTNCDGSRKKDKKNYFKIFDVLCFNNQNEALKWKDEWWSKH